MSAECRDGGHVGRMKDLDAVQRSEQQIFVTKRKAEASVALKEKRRLFKPRAQKLEVWFASYLVADWRYSMLVLVGGSKLGKTELAKDFKGPAQTLVVDCQHAAHPDLREFDPRKHKAVVMDDIAGSDFVLANKKLLQAHADGAKLGQSPTQTLAYEVFLWRVPVIVTTNHWSVAHHGAVDQEWLAKNCVVEEITEQVFLP